LVAEGTPLPVGSLVRDEPGFLAVLVCFCLGLWFCLAPCEDCCSPVLVPVGSGVLDVPVVVVLDDEELDPGFFEGEVEVEVEVELDEVGVVDELEELGVVDVVVVVVVVVTPADGVVVVDGVHCSFSDRTGPLRGRPIAEIGVPGATLTTKVSLAPPTYVTVTVHWSADAVARPTTAIATNNAPASARTVSSLRGPIMAVPLRPMRWCSLHLNNGRNLRRCTDATH
jgi:hypothetical protein